MKEFFRKLMLERAENQKIAAEVAALEEYYNSKDDMR